MVKEPLAAQLFHSVLHGFQSDFLNDNHTGVGDKRAAKLHVFFEVLAQPDNIIKQDWKQAAVIELNQHMAQISATLCIEGIFI
jgi:hypothetical protein